MFFNIANTQGNFYSLTSIQGNPYLLTQTLNKALNTQTQERVFLGEVISVEARLLESIGW